MKNKALRWVARDLVMLSVATALGGFTMAVAGDREEPPPVHYSGLINDYTPSAAVTKGGPYEMRGRWSLDVNERRGTAKFSAVMNMETSDYGIVQGTVDKDEIDPTKTRGAHTHHIIVTDGKVNSDWAEYCPQFAQPVSGGFVVTGPAYITVNGGKTPFANPSTATICVLGGGEVMFSNFTLTLVGPATGHFGTQAIHGVVERCAGPWEFESKDCAVQIAD
ncbi:MAG TPA: hypothetical protein VK743_17730 [Steroidobacteraceae bacterium]|nr:hypothetical protein [Steroidobacteraceae bacterium]